MHVWLNIIALGFSVAPGGARDIHIGIGDAAYSLLDASVANHLSKCTTLPGPWGIDTHIETIQCQPGASGRFLYVYMDYHRSWGYNQLRIREIQLYGCPEVEARM